MYKNKYIKYKNKYTELKKQYGGDNISLEFPNIIMNHPRDHIIDERIIINLLRRKQPISISLDFVDTYFCKYKTKYYPNNLIVCHTIQNEVIDDNKYILNNLENIEENVIFLHRNIKIEITEVEYNYINFYIKSIIDKYNTNLYISIAPLTLKEFYLPLFIQDYLTENETEVFTILIIGKHYNSPDEFSINTVDINTWIGDFKALYNDRVKFIHIYTNFSFTSDLFQNILNTSYKNHKINIYYNGLNACGLVYSKHWTFLQYNQNYLLIGCDGYKYKEIEYMCDKAKLGNPHSYHNFDKACTINLIQVAPLLAIMKQ